MFDQIKIFTMNDCDWYAAATPEEAMAALREIGCDEETQAEFGPPQELSEEDLDRLTFNDDGTKRTFREQLAKMIAEGQQFPCMFASTEF